MATTTIEGYFGQRPWHVCCDLFGEDETLDHLQIVYEENLDGLSDY